jgi:hypothetical protein
MENIKEKINEVQDYFNAKVLKGEYEILEKGPHTVTVLIDGCFKIELWIANTPNQHFKIHHREYSLWSNAKHFYTDEERTAGYAMLQSKLKPLEDELKQDEIAELEAKLNKLKNK